MESLFCSFFNHVVFSSPKASPSLVLSTNHFAYLFKLVQKTFVFCDLCDTYVHKEMIIKVREVNMKMVIV